MRIIARTLTIALITAAIAAPAAQAQQLRGGGSRAGSCGQALGSYFDQLEPVPLSAAEIAAVADLREEEKLARDVYLTLGERWQLPIFDRIASAEQKHMDHIVLLLEEYQIPDPVVDNTVGVFTSAEYTQLFEDLTAQGQISLVEALTVGATIEDLDLADIAALLDLSDNAHVGLIAHNLAKGSRNHLRAFVGALSAQGATYSAQFLDQATIDEILSSPWERRTIYDENGDVLTTCGGNGRGPRGGGRRGGGAGSGSCPNGGGGGNGSGSGGGNGQGGGGCTGSGPGGN